ncbi:MAG: glycerol-3-phosphate 1-O-acyltransferase PlsY [Ehrlichia sp.]
MDIYIIILASSYFIGSIPFGLILSHLGGLGDIRKIGSGNIGATNVFRKNKMLALLTLILDSAKGFVSVALSKSYVTDHTFAFIAALFTIIGHIFPIWLLFKGGKGVATLLGSLILIEYKLAACFIFIWILTIFKFRYSSLSSITSTIVTLILTYICYTKTNFIVFSVITSLVITQHASNIERMLKGTENKTDIKF